MCIKCLVAGRNLHGEESFTPYKEQLITRKAYIEGELRSINEQLELIETNPGVERFLSLLDDAQKSNMG